MTRQLDRIGLIAIGIYILGALSYYAAGVVRSPWHAALAMQLFFLLPPCFVGAIAYSFLQGRKNGSIAPRWLAVAALGTGAAVRLAWGAYLFLLARYNLAHPPTAAELAGPDLGPEFLLVFPYAVVCGILSIVAALALPRVVRWTVRQPGAAHSPGR